MRTLSGVVVVLALVVTPALAHQATQPSPQGPPAVVTHGEATIKRAPDQAWVGIAAEARAATPAEAQRTAADAMKNVQAALAKAGITPDAIRTTGYSLQPDTEYVNGRARVKGYIVRNQVEVRVDDLQKVGAVIDAAGSSGATSMSGLRFDLKDRAAAEREALTQAVRDAMARARALAAGAGTTLGAILRIDEAGETRPPVPYMTMRAGVAGAAPETPVSPGEVEIRGVVTLTVRIGG